VLINILVKRGQWNMPLLVTGVSGFIGSNFVYHYLDQNPEEKVIGLDALTYAGNLENLAGLTPNQKSRFIFIRGNVCDRDLIEKILRENAIQKIVHFAAESHVDRSILNSQIFLHTNIIGTAVLLDAAKKFWTKDKTWIEGSRFCQISTDEVYGSLGPQGYFSENTPLDPHSPYSVSKASADLLVKSYYDTYRMPILITRCSNNYGPYQLPEKLIPLTIYNALHHQYIPVYGTGTQIRDWIYVQDHCRAIEMVLNMGTVGEIYNVGGGNEKQNITLVKQIIDIIHEETCDPLINYSLIRFVKDRQGHDLRYAIDSSKIRQEMKWTPLIPFAEGIRSTIRWYLDHQSWMEHAISGEYTHFYEKNYSDR
jgi:dTDP-glucose 4,6-dehydratase